MRVWNTIGKMRRTLHRIWYRVVQTNTVLAKMSYADDPQVRAIAQVIRDSLKPQLTAAEQEWVSRIEVARTQLLKSDDTLVTGSWEGQHAGHESISSVCRISSKKVSWSIFLLKVIQHFHPDMCLELGTCLGISAAYQAAGLAINGRGRIITLEGSNARASLAQQNLHTLGLHNAEVIPGSFDETLPQILRNYGEIDYVFLDADHSELATVTHVERVLPRLSNPSLLIVDDISWSTGMRNAWNTISNHERVRISVDLFALGLCVIDTPRQTQHAYQVALW
ncbi:MAG: O-methyltransferase [Elainellaceae cyanobacterium]